MPHLFVIQTHKDPLQVSRLVRVLRRGYPDSVVVISQDIRSHALPRKLFGDDPDVHIIQGEGGRGDFATFAEARKEAEGLDDVHAARYLIGTPQLGDYLEEGVSQLGISLEDFEANRL